MTPDQIVSAVRAHLDRDLQSVVDGGDCRCEDEGDGYARPDCADRITAQVAAIRKLLDVYQQARAEVREREATPLPNAEGSPVAGMDPDEYQSWVSDALATEIGLEQAISILAQGLGIDTEEETS